MKRLAIFLAINLGFSGLVFAASPAPVATPVAPAASNAPALPAAPAIPVTTLMLNEQSAGTTAMLNLATTGVQEITSHAQKIQTTMNSIQGQAESDSNIGEDTTVQGYLKRVTSTVTDGQKSLQKLADKYKKEISDQNASSDTKLDSLAGTNVDDVNLASAYKNSLSAQALNSSGQIVQAHDSNVSSLATLQNTIQNSINAASAAAKQKSGSASLGKDVLTKILEGVTGFAVPLLTGLALYYARQIGCKFNIGVCPPIDADTQALIKKFGLPDNVNDLLAKVGCRNIAELLDKSALTAQSLKQELGKALGVTQDQITQLVKKAGAAAGASEEDIAGFLEKLGNIQSQIAKQLPDVDVKDVMTKVGQQLAKSAGVEIDVAQIVAKVSAELGGATPSTASGAASGSSTKTPVEPDRPSLSPNAPTVNTKAQGVFNQITASNNLREQLFRAIQQNSLTQDEFQAQLDALKANLVNLDGAQKAMAEEKIRTGEQILDEANGEGGATGETADNPFFEL